VYSVILKLNRQKDRHAYPKFANRLPKKEHRSPERVTEKIISLERPRPANTLLKHRQIKQGFTKTVQF
jgi:hypothetical protein